MLRAPPVHALPRRVAPASRWTVTGVGAPLTGHVVVTGPGRARAVVIITDVADRIGNVTRQRYEQLVGQAKELIAQVARAQFSLGHGVGD